MGAQLHFRNLRGNLLLSLQIQRPDVAVRAYTGASTPPLRLQAFFYARIFRYGGCAWETFGSAGVLYARSANPRTAATLIRFAANRGSS